MKKVLLVICFLASMVFCAGGAWGDAQPLETCVSNTTELQNALTTAGSNGLHDIIKVVQGTYTGNFNYSSSQGADILLYGGYTAAGCATRVVNPTNTILDGGGTGRVLNLDHVNGGSITVDGFTIQDGSFAFGNGGGVYAFSYSNAGTAGAIILTNNIIKGNSVNGDYSGGGVRAESYANSGTANNITLTNNIITGNTSANEAGGVMAYSHSNSGASGAVTITNNIIAGNTAADQGGGGAYASSFSGLGSGGDVTITNNTIAGNNTPGVSGRGGGLFIARDSNTINVYNNIIWGNTATDGDDIYLFGSSGGYNGYNNNYHELSGSWDSSGGNTDLDPLFVDASVHNYHLSSTSPCIDAGNNSAPGLPSTDIDGNARIITNSVDMGAYEYLCSNNLFKIGETISSYASIHAAYEAMTSGDTMQIHTSEYSEALALDLDKIVTLKGGYNCDFTSNTGYATVNGSVTITNGTVTIENITVK